MILKYLYTRPCFSFLKFFMKSSVGIHEFEAVMCPREQCNTAMVLHLDLVLGELTAPVHVLIYSRLVY